MGTSGAIGFKLDQKEIIFYNHSDSYPSWLGIKMVEYVQSIKDWNEIKDQVVSFQIVTDADKPTEEQKARAYDFGTINLSVSDRSDDDWYCLTREAQGDIGLQLALGFGLVVNNYPHDGLFCEYAYIINLDTMELEFYEGFNKDPNADGRYARFRFRPDSEYLGVKLVGEVPLDAIPEDWKEKFYPQEE